MQIIKDLPYPVVIDSDHPKIDEYKKYWQGDLYLPSSDANDRAVNTTTMAQQTNALILTIHGGGWSAFDKSTFDNVALFLCNNGYSVYNIDYRLTPVTPWPACGNDCLAAAKYLLSDAISKTVPQLDYPRQRIFVLGGSAGGHLALMTGLTLGSTKISGIISLSGIGDLVPDQATHSARYELLFASNSPDPELYNSASPLKLFQSLPQQSAPPVLFTHYVDDQVVPIAAAQNLAAVLLDTGNIVHTYYYDADCKSQDISVNCGIDSCSQTDPHNLGHHLWIPGSDRELLPVLKAEILEFLQRYQ